MMRRLLVVSDITLIIDRKYIATNGKDINSPPNCWAILISLTLEDIMTLISILRIFTRGARSRTITAKFQFGK